MSKWVCCCAVLIFWLGSCRSRGHRSVFKSKRHADTGVVMLPEIKEVMKKSFDFDYLSYKSHCDYKDADMEQSFNMSFRMKYDSILWVSVSAVGFEVARARLDRDSVKIFNRMEKKYYVYDYQFVKKLAGTSLSLLQIQYLLTANLLFPPQSFGATAEALNFKTTQGYIENTVTLDAHSRIITQFIQHLVEQSSAAIAYTGYKKYGKQQFPTGLTFNVNTPAKNMMLKMDISGVDTETIESFPFEIPAKYEKGN